MTMIKLLLLMLSLLRTNGLKSFSKVCYGYRSSSSSSSVLLSKQQHIVDGHLCNEISIKLKNNLSIIILEASAESQDKLVDISLESENDVDPYGSVLWPSSILCAEKLFESSLEDKVVLDVGTGTGLIAIAAILAGSRKAIAMDYNKFALNLLEKSKTLQNNKFMTERIETMEFDVKNFKIPLPAADVVCFADVLYEKDLGLAIADRVYESVIRGSRVIVVSPNHRPGKPFLLNRLKELFKNTNDIKNLDGLITTTDVAMPERNSLVSDIRGTTLLQEMFVLEL